MKSKGERMMKAQTVNARRNKVEGFEDPPVTRALFGQVRWAWIWLILRVYVGWQWLSAGWGKLHDATWTGSKAGTALSGFLNHSLTLTSGQHPAVQGWYGWFLQHVILPDVTFWSYVVSWGEFLVGVALILGIFTGLAAFFGSFMNMNYLLAGTVSLNPILFVMAVLLMLAWRTAGWWGLDRWLLPVVGTPWGSRKVVDTSGGQVERRTLDHPEQA
jgi:thiosulfate dehydrogenase [quinone] large subunit